MKTTIKICITLTLFFWCRIASAQCVATVTNDPVFCCSGFTTFLQATFSATECSCTNFQYSWTPTVGLSNPTIANPVVTSGSTTVYTVCVTSFKKVGCISICCQSCDDVTVTVNNSCCRTTDLEQGQGNTSIVKLFPNPAKTSLTIELTKAISQGSFIIFDVNGKAVLQKSISTDLKDLTIDVATLPRGVYFVKLDGSKKTIYSGKILLE